jgi:protein TonB
MMAFATTNAATLRRWAISAVVVLLVHGAVVTAVVTWRKTTVPAEAPGLVVIELAPMPAAPTTQQVALPPAPEQIPSTASPDKTPEKVEQKPQEKTAARGEEKAETSQFEESPRVTAPVTLAPPATAEGGNRADTKAVPGGEASGAVQAGGGGVKPLDTRIGEQPRQSFKKAAKANDWTKAIMGRPSKNFAGRQQPLGPGTPSGMARNAIGMLVQDPAGAMGTKGSTAANAAKNAVRVTAMNTVGGATVVNATATNAIGVSMPIRTRAPRTNIGQRGIGPLASNAMSPNASINGTSMIRPASATALIGGPATNVAGAINGTAMRPR